MLDRPTTSRLERLALVAVVLTMATFAVVSVGAVPVNAPSTFTVAQGTTCTAVEPIVNNSQSASDFYDYRNPVNTSPLSDTFSSFGTTDYQESQESSLLFYTGPNSSTLVLVHDQLGDESGGSTLTFTFEGLPASGSWVVQDDEYTGRDDDWFIQETSAQIHWMWAPNRTDGGVYDGLSALSDEPIVIEPEFNEEADYWNLWDDSGSPEHRIETWQLWGPGGPVTELDRDRRLFIHRGGCEVTPPAAALSGPASGDVNQTLTFDASGSSDDGTIGGYEWDFDGDGTVDDITTDPTVTHSYQTGGNFTASVTPFDTYGNGDTATMAVQITAPNEPPVAAIDGPDTAVENATIRLDAGDSTDDGTITGYRWDVDGDGTIDNTTSEASLAHTYAEPGTYEPAVTVVDDGGITDTANTTIEVGADEAPTASLSAPSSAFENQSISLDASGSSDDVNISTYRWDFDGDGQTDANTSVPTTEHAYAEPGTAMPAVTVVDTAGQTDTANATVDVGADDPPQASLSVPATVVINQTVTLNASGSTDDVGVDEYRWDVEGDGQVDRVTNSSTISHTYLLIGPVTPTVQVVDTLNQTNTTGATTDVQADDPPRAALSVSTPVVENLTITLDASGSTDDIGIAEYRWDVDGDGTVDETTTNQSLSHTYPNPGAVTPAVTAVDSIGQTNTTETMIDVQVDEPPQATLSAPETVTEDQPFTLDAGGSTDDFGIAVYHWDFDGDGQLERSTTDPTVSTNYSESAVVGPMVTVEDTNGQNNSTSTSILVQPDQPPNAVLAAPSSTIENRTIELDATASTDDVEIVEYEWDFDGDGDPEESTTSPTTSHNYTAPGSVTTVLTVVDSNGQRNTTTTTIDVQPNQPPSAALSAPASALANQSVTLDASSSTDDVEIVEYRWDFGDGQSNVTATATTTHAYETNGSFNASVTVVDSAGLTDDANVSIQTETDQPPTAALSAPATTGMNEPVPLDASDSADDDTITEYRWDFGDGQTDATATATTDHAYDTTGSFNVSVTVVDSGAQTDTAEVTIDVVDQPPTAELSAPDTALVNGTVTLDASNSSDDEGIGEYRWDVEGDGVIDENTTGSTISNTYPQTGTVEPTVTVVDSNGQSETASVIVEVQELSAQASVTTADPTAGSTVEFDASGSTPADQIETYGWSFPGQESAGGETAEQTFDSSGTHTVELRVTSADRTATTTLSVEVAESEADDGGGSSGGGSSGGGSSGGGSSGGGSSGGGSSGGGGGGGGAIGGGDGGGAIGGGTDSGEESDTEPTLVPSISLTDVNFSATRLVEGQSLDIQVRVENAGNGSGTKTVEFDIEGQIRETRNLSLQPNETVTVLYNYQFTTPGTKSIKIDHGPKRTVEVIPRRPNLTITSVQTPPSIRAGENFTVTATVENNGHAPGTRTYEFVLFGDIVDIADVTLEPGQRTSLEYGLSVSAPGNYTGTFGNQSISLAVTGSGTDTAPPPTESSGDEPSATPPIVELLVGLLVAAMAILVVVRHRVY